MSRKTNPRRRPATMADVERAKQEAQAEAISYAMTIFFSVLCDKHGATDAELRQFWDEVNYLSESIVQGYVSLADLPLSPYPPLFGHRSGKNMNTHWLCFMKPSEQIDMLERMERTMNDDLIKYRNAIERMGEFGQLFIDYVGCPRGAMGRQGAPLTEELLSMPVLTDVDGGRWRPVNEEALQEAITLLKEKGDE